MKLLTERDTLKRWLAELMADRVDVVIGRDGSYEKLKALDPETATEPDIRAIIGGTLSEGKSHWCGMCGNRVAEVVTSEHADDQYDTQICGDCARQAVKLIEGRIA